MADGVAQVVECLLSNPEALSSNQSTAKKKPKLNEQTEKTNQQ
jgi:hypothetical protein